MVVVRPATAGANDNGDWQLIGGQQVRVLRLSGAPSQSAAGPDQAAAPAPAGQAAGSAGRLDPISAERQWLLPPQT